MGLKMLITNNLLCIINKNNTVNFLDMWLDCEYNGNKTVTIVTKRIRNY